MRLARVVAVALCLIGLSVAPAFAQGAPSQGPTGGVELGFSMSRVSPDADGQSITVS